MLSVPINLDTETFFLVGRGYTSPQKVPSMYLQSAKVWKYDLGNNITNLKIGTTKFSTIQQSL